MTGGAAANCSLLSSPPHPPIGGGSLAPQLISSAVSWEVFSLRQVSNLTPAALHLGLLCSPWPAMDGCAVKASRGCMARCWRTCTPPPPWCKSAGVQGGCGGGGLALWVVCESGGALVAVGCAHMCTSAQWELLPVWSPENFPRQLLITGVWCANRPHRTGCLAPRLLWCPPP